MTKNADDYDYKPLRQGDVDGLCGVYAVLNALQWLVPAAQNYKYLTNLFGDMTLHKNQIINIDNVRDGGEEPGIEAVHVFVAKAAKKDFKVNFQRVPRSDDAKVFKTPDLAMESRFNEAKKEKEKGVFIFGFEGKDSHFTVATAVSLNQVALFDSWEYKYFDRKIFVWGREKNKSRKRKSEEVYVDLAGKIIENPDQKVIVDPDEFDWITIRELASRIARGVHDPKRAASSKT